MGSGYSANFEITIDENDVRIIVPNEFTKLDQTMRKYKIDLDRVAQSEEYCDSIEELEESEYDEVMAALRNLYNKFKKKTGIDIALCYHDSNEYGDRYDDVNGYFFALNFDDVYKKTAKAKKLFDAGVNIGFSYYVSFG